MRLSNNDFVAHEGPVQAAEALYDLDTFWKDLKADFESLQMLHAGIEWVDVEASLRADPEALARLTALNAKGHHMRVFGEEGGELVFVSGWTDIRAVSPDHRNFVYDAAAQKLLHTEGYVPEHGNALNVLGRTLGVTEDEAGRYLADACYHNRLRFETVLSGAVTLEQFSAAYLRTSGIVRDEGKAMVGNSHGVYMNGADAYSPNLSLRAQIRVKKVKAA